MLGRLLDDSFAPQVRERITLLTLSRLATNAAYRFALPFLGTIARGFDVSLDRAALALSLAEIGGFFAPVIGGVVDRQPRRRMIAGGLVVMAAAAYGVAASPTITVFSVALLVLALAKLVFDISVTGWVSERVPFAQRGRAVGIVELSWAGGLLIGVPVLGLVTWATSFHVAYAVIATVLLATAVLVVRLLEADPARRPPEMPLEQRAADRADRTGGAIRRVLPILGANFTLMFAAQSAFVTMGSWLEDDYRFSAAALAAMSFGLGVGELAASSGTVRFTDTWGKRRSAQIGALLMVPTGLLLALGHGVLAIGLVALILFILGFEFAIVSMIPLGTLLVPGRPSTGLGLMMIAGTLGRAACSVPAARLYEAHGITAPILVGAGVALLCLVCTTLIREPAHA